MAYIFEDLEVTTLCYFSVTTPKIQKRKKKKKRKEKKAINVPWGPLLCGRRFMYYFTSVLYNPMN